MWILTLIDIICSMVVVYVVVFIWKFIFKPRFMSDIADANTEYRKLLEQYRRE